MSKIARKLVLSVLTVVLTVAALGTTTFAWFTLTNTAVVQPFSANITTDTGIEFAIGDLEVGQNPSTLNWVNQLSATVVQNWIESKYGQFTFTHVTTTNAVDYFTLGATALTGTTSGYLTIPLHFRSNTANHILWSAVTLTAPTTSYTADTSFVGAKGTSFISGDTIEIVASDAIRIAILGTVDGSPVVIGYESPNSTTNAVLGGGIANPQNLADGVAVGQGNQGAMNYFYSKNTYLPFGANSVSVLATQVAIAGETILQMAGDSVATAGATYYGQIQIRVWVEGWDANAYNSILGKAISAGFVFDGTFITPPTP